MRDIVITGAVIKKKLSFGSVHGSISYETVIYEPGATTQGERVSMELTFSHRDPEGVELDAPLFLLELNSKG